MKKILIILLLFVGIGYAQSSSRYNVAYGDTSLPGNAKDSLIVAVGDSISGQYYINEQLIYLQVDSNWTAANIAIMIYNPLEATWELLYDEAGNLVEYTIVQGTTTGVVPIEMAGAKRVKFVKMTAGSYVAQATNASTIIVHTIRY